MSKAPQIPLVPPPPAILALPEGQVGTGDNRTRMTSATECRKLVIQVINEDTSGGRAWQRLLAKKNYDGNRPYAKKPPGQAWTANVNFLGMEGLISSARVPYYALFSGVPTYATFCTDYQYDNPDSEKWNAGIAQAYSRCLNRWKSWRWHNRAKEYEMLFEGYGVKLREDPTDWRFKAVPSRCVYVPVEAPSFLDERVPFIVIRREYRIHELYNKIADEKVARERGWNVEQVQWAIKFAAQKWGGPNWQQAPFEIWQQRLKNHEISTSYTDSDIVSCAHVFVQEYAQGAEPGKVSHFVITEGFGGPENKDGYLFSHPNAYERYSQVVIPCFQDTGDGTWHSVRGLAYKSFRHIELQNRLKCRAIDNAFLAAGPIIQEGDNQAKDALQLAVLGPVTVLKKGANFIPHRLGAETQGILAVDRMLENNLAQNIGQFNQRSMSREDGRGEQPTATQVELQASKETSLTQAQIDSYYDDLDTEHEEMFAIMIKGYDSESRKFLADCKRLGVPEEALKQMGSVKANRLSGYPSPELRKRRILEFQQIFGASLPEDGKLAMLDEAILAFFGPDKLKVLNPRMDKPEWDTAWATAENAMMLQEVVPQIISGMNDVKHLQIHLGEADKKFTPMEEQMEAGQPIPEEEMQEAYGYATALGVHCEEHLGRLRQDPARKAEADTFEKQLENILGFHGRLRSAILEAQHEAEIAAQEEAQATALGALDQAKVQSAQIEDQIKIRKAGTDTQIKVGKTQAGIALNREKAGAKARLDAANTAHRMMLESEAAKNKSKNNERNGK